MSVTPQYTYDNEGNPIGVFLTINEWNQVAEALNIEPPQWQKNLINARLQEYQSNPGAVIDADVFLSSLEKEDE